MSGVTHFLIVAVEKYNNQSDFGKISFAEKDATELRDAFISLGYDPNNMILLLNSFATGTAIVQNLKKIVEQAREEDRIVFYFSGHGLYVGGRNMLVPADAIGDKEADTCILIDTIMEILYNAHTERNILFLDCCHSGIHHGEHTKDGAHEFNGDDLAYKFRKAEYCIGFAACKSNQKSYTHPQC